MDRYRNRLPDRPTHRVRTPLTVMGELAQLHVRFGMHHLKNMRRFWEEYSYTLPPARIPSPQTMLNYTLDAAQRQILFWDILRRRGNRYIDHAAAGNPPVLVFDYEMVLDAETFDDPCNYALVRIVPPEGMVIDEDKRPFVIVDPRAGHGPGIGGFKLESQVGNALSAGHPVYFVIFKMHPVPGQTLRDVAQAEAQFLQWVAAAHPNAPKPCVMGNCQGGWAIMGVAASHPNLTGPLVLSGAPLSYWAGVTGKNPMRYLGGLVGGSWLALMTSDMEGGEFDGVNLVSNFESLDPANSLWSKYYNLYAHADTEANRFLDFERWWGGYIFLTAQEMRSILDNLFIGNKLSHSEINIEGSALDLRRIQQPIVVFCSAGDNITPPQQALNWIVDLYEDEREIKAAGQVIVYIVHASSGHLGIFVSGAIIRREQQQIASTLEEIEALPPGLYEMVISDTGSKAKPRYDIRLEERRIEDLFHEGCNPQQDEDEFELVRVVSDFNEKLYEFFVSPAVRTLSNPFTTGLMRQLHPLRVQHWGISDLNPFFWPLATLKKCVDATRAPIAEDNPLLKLEQANSKAIEFCLNSWRDTRDIASETMFYTVYGMLASSKLANRFVKPHGRREADRAQNDALVQTMLDSAADGDIVDASMRILLLLTHARGYLTKTEIDEIRARLSGQSIFTGLSRESLRQRLTRQTVIVSYQPELALGTLPQLLSHAGDRHKVIKLLGQIDGIGRKESAAVHAMWERIMTVLENKRTHDIKPRLRIVAQ